VRSVTVADGIATVDLNQPFATGTSPASMLARLSELVQTLTGMQGTKKVQLLVNGTPTTGMFPGVSTSGPITLRFLQTPNVPVPVPLREKLPPDPAVKKTQQRLIALGYLLPGDDDGRFGPATQNAILAFQKWERLDRTGLLDSRTKLRLAAATHPSPLTRGGPGKRAEILLDRQVALLIANNKVIRTIAVSSGKPSTPTPPATIASTPRSRAGGRCRSENGSPTRCRSSAVSPSTSSPTCPPTQPHTAASASRPQSPRGPTASRTSACPSR
jgi:peptidoglycan hydrolase-like protein with peptidoglycan-binding domain